MLKGNRRFLLRYDGRQVDRGVIHEESNAGKKGEITGVGIKKEGFHPLIL